MTYEVGVEYVPEPCEMAARAVTMSKAEIIYPTHPNPKRASETKAKRAKYVEEHWHEVHPQILATLQANETRQRYKLIEQRTFDYLNGLKNNMIPRINHWEEHLEQ